MKRKRSDISNTRSVTESSAASGQVVGQSPLHLGSGLQAIPNDTATQNQQILGSTGQPESIAINQSTYEQNILIGLRDLRIGFTPKMYEKLIDKRGKDMSGSCLSQGVEQGPSRRRDPGDLGEMPRVQVNHKEEEWGTDLTGIGTQFNEKWTGESR